ncbi:MAG: glycosyltransferase [Hydrotalea sp.]|nr:glycosyltransferase [Hydrotalea sp.]
MNQDLRIEKSRIVSVIVTTYNRTIRLENNIRALLNQDLESDVQMEIIIVDDCSTPYNSQKAAQIASQSDQILLIVNPTNKGLSGSRNVGALYAKGEYLLFLDDDIMAESGYVMGHLSILSKEDNVATVGSLRFPPELTRNNNLMKYLSSRELRQRNLDDLFLSNLTPQYLGGGICGMKRFHFTKVGGFSESFTFYGGEDVQMGDSLNKLGVRIKYAPDARADHFDTVNIERYRVKYMEAGREGIRLIISTNSLFFKKSNIRFLLPPPKNESLKDMIMRILVTFALNKYTELLLRYIAKRTNRYGFLYSKILYHVLFACWMYAGLKQDRSIGRSQVIYSN